MTLTITSLKPQHNKSLCDEFGGPLTFDQLITLLSYLSMKATKYGKMGGFNFIKKLR